MSFNWPPPPDLTGAGAPQVDAGSQPHAQQVPRRPVHQVEVEVVLQLRGVQHFEGDLGDLPCGFAGGTEQLVTGGRRTSATRAQNIELSEEDVSYLLLLRGEREYGETSLSLSKGTLLVWTVY